MSFERGITVDADLAARLVAEQFPQWAGLPVQEVALQGWDNRTYRLGDTLAVRLPSAEWYVAQGAKEHKWLPRLAPHLPLPIPEPVARGAPSDIYPWPWSINRWLPGEPAATTGVPDHLALARDLARFLTALQAVDPAGGPEPGPHCFFRGGALATYDAEARAAIAAIGGEWATAAIEVWEQALAATWTGPPVWVHGDVAAGNLLIRQGRLSAVIDFGCCAVGDPACDTVFAWTFLSGESRAAFRAALSLDDATWRRGRGWALWKAAIMIAGGHGPRTANGAERVIADVLAEHARERGTA